MSGGAGKQRPIWVCFIAPSGGASAHFVTKGLIHIRRRNFFSWKKTRAVRMCKPVYEADGYATTGCQVREGNTGWASWSGGRTLVCHSETKAACNGSSMKCGIRYTYHANLGRTFLTARSIELLTFIWVTAHTQAHHHTETQQYSGLQQELRLTGLLKHRQWGK